MKPMNTLFSRRNEVTVEILQGGLFLVRTYRGIKQKTPHNNTLSRKPLKFSEFAIHLILYLKDVLI